jgi:hypothetical protein
MERSFSAERRSPTDSSRLLHRVMRKPSFSSLLSGCLPSPKICTRCPFRPQALPELPKLGTARPFPLPQCDFRLVQPHFNPFIPHGWRLAPPYPWLGCLLKRYLCHHCPFHFQKNGGGGWVGYSHVLVYYV